MNPSKFLEGLLSVGLTIAKRSDPFRANGLEQARSKRAENLCASEDLAPPPSGLSTMIFSSLGALVEAMWNYCGKNVEFHG